jgi:hypothetical protein
MDIWSVSIFDIGLTDYQFWRLTLRQYNALVKRLNEKEEAQRYNHAAILAQIHNTTATKKSELMKPEDFLGKSGSQMDQKDLDQKIHGYFAMLKKLRNA